MPAVEGVPAGAEARGRGRGGVEREHHFRGARGSKQPDRRLRPLQGVRIVATTFIILMVVKYL